MVHAGLFNGGESWVYTQVNLEPPRIVELRNQARVCDGYAFSERVRTAVLFNDAMQCGETKINPVS